MEQVIKYIAESSPFGAFCISVLFIQYLTYRHYTKQLAANFKTSLEIINSNYETNLDFLSTANDSSLVNKIKGKK